MSSDLGYYIGMGITTITGVHVVIEPNKYSFLSIVLLGFFVLACAIIGGIIGAIIQESITKTRQEWIGKKKQRKQSLGG